MHDCTMPAHSSYSETLPATAVASPPASRMFLIVISREPGSGCVPSWTVRAVAMTFAPSAAKHSAIAAPMPRLAPVTIATLPSNLPMSFSSRLVGCCDLVLMSMIAKDFTNKIRVPADRIGAWNASSLLERPSPG